MQPNETVGIKVQLSIKLEKFDGEYEPGMEPVETIVIDEEKEIDNGTDHSRS